MNPNHTPFIQIIYGSKLFGTSTPESDTDKKVVYLPSIDSLLLNEKISAYSMRYDADGVQITDKSASMPADGVETEYIPIQTFVRDYVLGQTYAVEIAFAHLATAGDTASRALVDEMIQRFSTRDLKPMVDFAMKQTFDYVHRGERMMKTRQLLNAIDNVYNNAQTDRATLLNASRGGQLRLDTIVDFGETGSQIVIDALAQATGTPMGTLENNGKIFRTLEFNGRQFMESMQLRNLRDIIQGFVKEYGERVSGASTKKVDWKSLSHAIRVYDEVIEMLTTGAITFPRPDANYLRSVKQGLVSIEDVQKLLIRLDRDVVEAIEKSSLPARTPELIAEADQFILSHLRNLYAIQNATWA